MRLLLSLLLCVLVVPGQAFPLVDEARQARQLSGKALTNAREDAVRLARRGDYDTALKRLEHLRKMAPDNDALLWDYIAVLSWAGQDDKVRRLRQRNDMSRAPDWLMAMLQKPDPASVPRSGGQPDDSTSTDSKPLAGEDRPDNAATEEQQSSPSTTQHGAAQTDRPATPTETDDERLRRRVAALHSDGRFIEAWQLASTDPGAFDEARLLSLQGDQTAERIRAARQGHVESDKRRDLQKEATAALKSFCASARQRAVQEAIQQCRRDTMVWYAATGREGRAASLYESLANQAAAQPAYVHRAAYELYLDQGRLDRALSALERLEGATDTPHPALRGEIMMARGRYAEARNLFLEAAAQEPDDNSGETGGARTALEQKAVTAEAWRGHLDHAQNRAETLREQNPENVSVGLQLQTLYRWQGLPRHAEAERQRLAQIDRDNGALLRARIEAAIDERRFADADELLARFRRLYPGDPAIDSLTNQLNTAAGPRFTGEWRRSGTTGEGITEATHGSYHRQRLYSAAWQRLDDTRLFIDRHHYHAEYRGGRGSIRRRGAGLITEHRDWGFTLGWHEQVNASEASGINLSGHVELSDYWGIDLDYQRDSDRTPVRAAINDIEASSSGIAVRHHRADGHDYRASAWFTGFSDDNQRREYALSGSHPLYRDSPHRLLLREFLGYSSNTNTATPYFSPASSAAAEMQLDYTGLLRDGSSGRWTHNAVAGLGVSTQRGFSASPIWDITYEHRYRLNRHFTAAAGYQWLSRMYDGNTELTQSAFLRVGWRFR